MEKMRKCKIFLATPMYGGSCEGIFAKSISDLTASCAQRGIGLVVHFLMNESLIPRARNYCVDAFMRSDCTHLMFIDADIGFSGDDVLALLAYSIQNEGDNPYDIIGGSYPKKSCPAWTKVITEDGSKKIKWIVDNKYTGKVLSQNKDTYQFEWKPVIKHFNSKGNGKKWVSLITKSTVLSNLIVTYDHEVAVTDDCLFPTIKYVQASETLGKYLISPPINKSTTNKFNCSYNKEQISFLIGTMFGDGCITKTGYLKFGHSDAQYRYLELKRKLFGGKISKERNTGNYKNKQYKAKFLECPRNSQITKLRELFYVDGKKTIKNVIEMLDERGLAFWYMDDGSYHGDNVRIHTQSFNYEDHLLIQKHFKDKWDIETTTNQKAENGNNILYIKKESHSTFFSLINKYIIKELEYKIPEEFRLEEKHQFNTELLPFGTVEVKEVREKNYRLTTARNQYDITVEDNHNFIGDGFVVHNCISWEKIKVAVDKGFGDNNPNELEKFVGDFVFNPLPGTTQIKLNEPAEVLEIGTGFMMARRATFEKFQEAYPDYMYRPDHVRDENFDGKRKIMMFFQSEIDPESERYLSEDYWFMQKARKIGLRTWLCPWMGFGHAGKYIFSGSVYNMAQLGVSATADQGVLDQIKKNKQ